MNLLFTSAGRRGYVLRYFKEELDGSGTVHAANSKEINSAFLDADCTTITPLIHDREYISYLLDYCQKKQIKAIIPLFDLDVPVIAMHRDEFLKIGVTLVNSPIEVAKICNDKWKTYLFLKKNGFRVPQTFTKLEKAKEAIHQGELTFPIVLKPRFGMGSIGLYMAENIDELSVLYTITCRDIQRTYLKYESKGPRDGLVLMQQMLSGQEYGLDVVNDLKGAYAATFVKKKIAMRAGETDVAMTVDSQSLSDLGQKLSLSLCHYANLDVDVFLVEGKPYVLEMNARIGGGYPFSHIAGANLPRAVISWINGQIAEPSCFALRPGVIGLKTLQPRVLKQLSKNQMNHP